MELDLQLVRRDRVRWQGIFDRCGIICTGPCTYADFCGFGPATASPANTPWSGHYSLSSFVYVTMQHTQFHHVGWRYLNASAVLPPANASNKYCFNSTPPPDRTDSHWKPNFSTCVARSPSFIALVSPGGEDFSVVVETVTVRLHLIRNACIENAGNSESCMVYM